LIVTVNGNIHDICVTIRHPVEWLWGVPCPQEWVLLLFIV